MFLTLQANGMLPEIPGKYSGRRSEWYALKESPEHLEAKQRARSVLQHMSLRTANPQHFSAATASNIAAAQSYADNPFLSGQIDAVSRDVSRNLSEDILPSIDRAASATGNINSSRAGIASGVAQRGAADRVADIAASMRGDAYDSGLRRTSSSRRNSASTTSKDDHGQGCIATFS